MIKLTFLLRGSTLCFSATLLAAAPATPPKEAIARALASVPAWFEPNQGWARKEVKYQSRGAGYRLSMEQSGAVVALTDGAAIASVRISLVGSNPDAGVEAEDPLPGRSSYILGTRSSRWKHGVPHFGSVRYRSAYPGIDLVYYGSGKQLEYDFVVSPGANPSQIRLRFEGAESVRLDGSGSLVIGLGGRELRQPRPRVYQQTPDLRRVEIGSDYIVRRDGEVRFALGRYDRTQTLIIDPVLTYAGYYGGEGYDVPTGIAVDKDGYLWVTGTTLSVVEPVEGSEPYQSEPVGSTDAFVAKLRLEASGPPTLLYWTYLGGAAYDYGGLIEVDAEGKVYLTGSTYSSNFPLSDNTILDVHPGSLVGFAVKLDPDAAGDDSLIYGTMLGGSGYDTTTALFVEPGGTMLVGGYTASIDIAAIVPGVPQASSRGGYDAFVFRIDPNAGEGATVLYATYLGGEGTDILTGLVSDASGVIYATGFTTSKAFPAWYSYRDRLNGDSDVFLAKLDPSLPDLDGLVAASYLGGSGLDAATALRIDPAGRLWLSGYTMSADFPVTPGAYQPVYAGGETDAFLLCFDFTRPPEQAIVYSTFFGGSGTEVIYAPALMQSGRIAIAGYTLSDNLPLKNAPPRGQSRSLDADAFVAILDTGVAGADALLYSTYFGGSAEDNATRIALGPAGSVYVSGMTGSQGLPVTDGSTRRTPPASTTGFILRIDPLPGENPAMADDPGIVRRQPAGTTPQTRGARR